MKAFLIVIQLSRKTTNNYIRLTNLLSPIGATKIITDKSKNKYILPEGNYCIETAKSVKEVATIIIQAVSKMEVRPMVLVSEVVKGGIAWDNLPPAN